MSTVLSSRPHPPFSPASRPQPPAASHAHPPKSAPPAAVSPAPIPAVTSPSPQLISLVRSLVGEQIKEWIETVHVGNIERSQRILQEQKETMNLIQNLSSYLQKIDQKLQNSNEMVGLLSKKTHNQANDIITLYQKIQELASATQQPPQQLQQPFEEPMISKKIHEILQSHSELKQQIVCQNEKIQEFQLTLSELARDFHDSQSSAEENLTKTSDYFQTLHTELYNDIHSQKERTEKSFQESNLKLEQLSAQLATATAISAAAAAPVPSTVMPMSLSEPHSVGEQQQEREQLQGLYEQRQEVFEKRVRAELEVLQREQRLLEREMALLRGEFQHSNNTMGITMGSPSSQRFQQQPQLLYSPPPLAFSSQPRNEHQQLQLQSPQGQGWQQGQGQQETSSELLSPRTPYPHNHRTYIPPSSAATAELSSSFPFPISGPAVSVSVTPRYSDPSMTLHEDPHEDDPPPPSVPGPSSMNPNLSNASLHSFDSTSASAAGSGAGIRPGSATGAGAGGDGSSNSGRSHRSKNLQRQKTLSDELIALLDIISEKERDVRSASEKKTMIKHFIKAKLTEFQQRYGRYPTMEEKEAMAEIYFQHQEAALLKEEAMLSLQDAKELLEEKRAELEQISFEEEEERGTGRLGEGERQEEAKL
jgi:hypothetical protein